MESFNLMMPPAKVNDELCWECYGNSASVKCSMCSRAFHQMCISRCIKLEPSTVNIQRCHVCQKIDGKAKADKPENLQLLPSIVDEAFKMDEFTCLRHLWEKDNDSKLQIGGFEITPINLWKLKQNIASYTRFDDFLCDLTRIENSINILFPDNSVINGSLYSMLDHIRDEIPKGKHCGECYRNSKKYPNFWFAMVCNEPHLVVWIERHDSLYWPAKLMSIDSLRGFLHLQFFGDHSEVEVLSSSCFLCADMKMTTYQLYSLPSEYMNALNELKTYFTNISEEFGPINHFKKKTAFHPSKYVALYNFMFPTDPLMRRKRKSEKDYEREEKKSRITKKAEMQANVLNVQPEVIKCLDFGAMKNACKRLVSKKKGSFDFKENQGNTSNAKGSSGLGRVLTEIGEQNVFSNPNSELKPAHSKESAPNAQPSTSSTAE